MGGCHRPRGPVTTHPGLPAHELVSYPRGLVCHQPTAQAFHSTARSVCVVAEGTSEGMSVSRGVGGRNAAVPYSPLGPPGQAGAPGGSLAYKRGSAKARGGCPRPTRPPCVTSSHRVLLPAAPARPRAHSVGSDLGSPSSSSLGDLSHWPLHLCLGLCRIPAFSWKTQGQIGAEIFLGRSASLGLQFPLLALPWASLQGCGSLTEEGPGVGWGGGLPLTLPQDPLGDAAVAWGSLTLCSWPGSGWAARPPWSGRTCNWRFRGLPPRTSAPSVPTASSGS